MDIGKLSRFQNGHLRYWVVGRSIPNIISVVEQPPHVRTTILIPIVMANLDLSLLRFIESIAKASRKYVAHMFASTELTLQLIAKT